jgi:hypothetical protein
MSKPQRIQISRKKGWRMPVNTVNCARPNKWGNPFKVGIATPELAVDQFVKHMGLPGDYKIPSMQEALDELRGKNLACWCKIGEPCHADALLDIANRHVKKARKS